MAKKVEVLLELQDKLSRNIKKASAVVTQLRAELDATGKSKGLDGVTATAAKAQKATDRVSKSASRVNIAIHKLNGASLSKATAGVNKMDSAAVRLRNSVTRAGSAVRWTNRAIGALAALGGFTIATAKAVAFDKKMAEVATLVDTTKNSVESLSDAALKLSSQFGASNTTVASAMYQAISAGAEAGAEANLLLEDSLRAATAGVTDAETAVDTITSVVNAYGLKMSDATEISDSLFTTVKGGKTTFEEIGRSIAQVSPIAAALGIDFKEVNAGIAALTLGGTATSVAITQIRSALSALTRPTTDLLALFKDFGGAQKLIDEKGYKAAFDVIAESAGGDIGQLTKLLGSVEAVNAVLGLTGSKSKVFQKALGDQAKAAGATEEAFKKVDSALSTRLTKSLTQISNGLTKFGVALLAVIVPVTEMAASFANWYTEMSSAHPALTTVLSDLTSIGIVVGTIIALGKGTVLTGWFSSIKTGVLGMLAPLRLVGTAGSTYVRSLGRAFETIPTTITGARLGIAKLKTSLNTFRTTAVTKVKAAMAGLSPTALKAKFSVDKLRLAFSSFTPITARLMKVRNSIAGIAVTSAGAAGKVGTLGAAISTMSGSVKALASASAALYALDRGIAVVTAGAEAASAWMETWKQQNKSTELSMTSLEAVLRSNGDRIGVLLPAQYKAYTDAVKDGNLSSEDMVAVQFKLLSAFNRRSVAVRDSIKAFAEAKLAHTDVSAATTAYSKVILDNASILKNSLPAAYDAYVAAQKKGFTTTVDQMVAQEKLLNQFVLVGKTAKQVADEVAAADAKLRTAIGKPIEVSIKANTTTMDKEFSTLTQSFGSLVSAAKNTSTNVHEYIATQMVGKTLISLRVFDKAMLGLGDSVKVGLQRAGGEFGAVKNVWVKTVKAMGEAATKAIRQNRDQYASAVSEYKNLLDKQAADVKTATDRISANAQFKNDLFGAPDTTFSATAELGKIYDASRRVLELNDKIKASKDPAEQRAYLQEVRNITDAEKARLQTVKDSGVEGQQFVKDMSRSIGVFIKRSNETEGLAKKMVKTSDIDVAKKNLKLLEDSFAQLSAQQKKINETKVKIQIANSVGDIQDAVAGVQTMLDSSQLSVTAATTLDPKGFLDGFENFSRQFTSTTRLALPVVATFDTSANALLNSEYGNMVKQLTAENKAKFSIDMASVKNSVQKAGQAMAAAAKNIPVIEFRGKITVSGGQGQKFATGGAVVGAGTGTSDSIPAMLSNGEFVMNASAVQRYGQGFMSMLNSLQAPSLGFAAGGSVGGNKNQAPDTPPVEINLNIGGTKSRLQGSQDQVDGLITALQRVGGSLV